MKKNKDITALSKLTEYIVINVGLFLINIFLLVFLKYSYKENILMIINVVLLAIFVVAMMIILCYTSYIGWCSLVYFDNERVYHRKGRKIITWEWKDCTDIEAKTHRNIIISFYSYAYPRFKLYSSKHDEVLTFVLNDKLMDEFCNLCTNEKICEKFNKLINECDYPFPKSNFYK